MAAMENIQSTHLLARPVVEVSSRIFNGASFQLELGQHGDDDHLETLSALPSVKNVWPVREIQLPEHEVHWTGENPASQGGFQNARSTTGFAPHVLTQVDRLHKEGFTGKGIKVGILDGGIDWKHPALGGCFGSGCVVARGYDFVGDDDWNRKPDPDPYTSCNGHGTHVAGIIAAQENKHGFLGVAPGVELGMYRVLGCDRSGSEDIIIAGLLKAFEDGSDIITASLGGLSGWSRSAAGVTLERIVQAGVIWYVVRLRCRKGAN
jgi:subtilisin family serine protease